MNLYAVQYPVNGQSVVNFIVAGTDTEASAFVGVRDGSAAVRTVAKDIEIVGIDAPHAAIVPPAPYKAAFEVPKAVSRQEFDALQAQIVALTKELNTPSAPQPTSSREPTPVQADPLPKE